MLIPSSSKKHVDVTVFIPTFNGERYLDQILNNLESQKTTDSFEILIIDSGSTDDTLRIIAAHPAVRLVQISSAEFGHGRTRNQAAKLARGEYLVYLSHDAVPVGENFLENIVLPLKPRSEGGLEVQGVVGKHVARAHAHPSMKYGIASVFRLCGPDAQVSVVDGSMTTLEQLHPGQLFYSDVCSATRRSFLLKTLPYQDLPYAEDMAFGKDLITGGFAKAYQPDAVVQHSNDVTLREYPKRMFDETVGMRRVNPQQKRFGVGGTLLRFAKETLLSGSKIIRDPDYSWPSKPYWMFTDMRFVAAKWRGIYRGQHVDLNDSEALARYSLEAERA